MCSLCSSGVKLSLSLALTVINFSFLEEPATGKRRQATLDTKRVSRGSNQGHGCPQGDKLGWERPIFIVVLQVPHCSNYFAGDPYVGSQAEKVKELNKRINDLEAENKRLKKQLEER